MMFIINCIGLAFWTMMIGGSFWLLKFLWLSVPDPGTNLLGRITCWLGMIAISEFLLFLLGIFLKGIGWWPNRRRNKPPTVAEIKDQEYLTEQKEW